MEERSFDFLQLAPCSNKPRSAGLTTLGDQGHPLSWLREMLEAYGDNVPGIVAEMRRLLAAGCEHVYLESRVIRDVIGDYGEKTAGADQIRQIVDTVGVDKVFIEISGQLPFDTRQCHRFWAVHNFGPEVNLGGGGSIDEVRHIESIRRGFAFVNGPGQSTTKLWVKSLAKNHGKASAEWWKEEYPIS